MASGTVKEQGDERVAGQTKRCRLTGQTGVIFGNITYDEKTSDASANIVLSDIHLDIMDYIKPNYVNEATFRSSWTGKPFTPPSQLNTQFGTRTPQRSRSRRWNIQLVATLTPRIRMGKQSRPLCALWRPAEIRRPPHKRDQPVPPHARKCARRRLFVPLVQHGRQVALWRGRASQHVLGKDGEWADPGAYADTVPNAGDCVEFGRQDYAEPEGFQALSFGACGWSVRDGTGLGGLRGVGLRL